MIYLFISTHGYFFTKSKYKLNQDCSSDALWVQCGKLDHVPEHKKKHWEKKLHQADI
jgi:hypothetical protein